MSDKPNYALNVRAAIAALHVGDYLTAIQGFRGLVSVAPVLAYNNLSVAYGRLGDWRAAEAALRSALAVDPSAFAPRKGLAILLMAQGRWVEGWPLFEDCRRQQRDRFPQFPFPEWRGEDLAGKRILLVREEGFGDQIQFARFLPQLRQAGAHVSLICSPTLLPLFESWGIELLATGSAHEIAADYWCGICSLGHLLAITLETLPSKPYIQAWGLSSGGGVGVVSRGRPEHFNDTHRSLRGSAEAQLMQMGRDLSPVSTGARNFADTAEIIAALDLVITVDTSIAHLAGAMGKPVWILLSAFDTDWRWMHDRTDSPWYPSARLYRQVVIDDWEPVISAVERDLAAFAQP